VAALVVAVPVCAAALVAVAHANPWQYLHLRRFGGPGAALGVIAVGLCAVPLLLPVLRRERYLPAALVGTVPLLAMTVLLAAVIEVVPDYPQVRPFVHDARSADGRFTLVGATCYPWSDSDAPFFLGWRVRRGNGLLTQQSERRIVEFWSDSPVDMASIGFGAPGTVEIRTTDGRRWSVDYDRRNATPAHTLAFTAGAPGGVRRA
jgi:hypothetical protein